MTTQSERDEYRRRREAERLLAIADAAAEVLAAEEEATGPDAPLGHRLARAYGALRAVLKTYAADIESTRKGAAWAAQFDKGLADERASAQARREARAVEVRPLGLADGPGRCEAQASDTSTRITAFYRCTQSAYYEVPADGGPMRVCGNHRNQWVRRGMVLRTRGVPA